MKALKRMTEEKNGIGTCIKLGKCDNFDEEGVLDRCKLGGDFTVSIGAVNISDLPAVYTVSVDGSDVDTIDYSGEFTFAGGTSERVSCVSTGSSEMSHFTGPDEAYSMCSCCGQNLETGECSHISSKEDEVQEYLQLYDKGLLSKRAVLERFNLDKDSMSKGLVTKIDKQECLQMYDKGLLSKETVLARFDVEAEESVPICSRKVSEEREALIAQALETSDGKTALAKTMGETLFGRPREYQAIGRKLLMVDELPQGAYARYNRDETEVASLTESYEEQASSSSTDAIRAQLDNTFVPSHSFDMKSAPESPVNYDDVKELAIKQKATCIRPLCLNSISTLISDVESFIEDDGSVDYLVVDQIVYNKMCENKLIGKETVVDLKEIAEGHVTDVFNAKLIVTKDNRGMMTAISTSKDTHMTIGFSDLKPTN